MKNENIKIKNYNLKSQNYILPFKVIKLEPRILAISNSSSNNRLIFSLFALLASLSKASQNLLSLADFKAWWKNS